MPAVGGHYRRTYSLSLDCIASARERPYPRPREPLTQRPLNQTTPQKSEALWEHIPSSPVMPPSSPAAESFRLLALPKNNRSKRSLEWACLNARVVHRSTISEEPEEDMDVPSLVMDTESADAGEETEIDEAVTPDISSHCLTVPCRSPSPMISKTTKAIRQDAPEEDMEAAIALLGFMGGRD